MVLLMVLLAETGLAFIVVVAQQVVEFPARLHVRQTVPLRAETLQVAQELLDGLGSDAHNLVRRLDFDDDLEDITPAAVVRNPDAAVVQLDSDAEVGSPSFHFETDCENDLKIFTFRCILWFSGHGMPAQTAH